MAGRTGAVFCGIVKGACRTFADSPWRLGARQRSFQPHPRYSSCGDNQCGLIAEGQWKGFRGV